MKAVCHERELVGLFRRSCDYVALQEIGRSAAAARGCLCRLCAQIVRLYDVLERIAPSPLNVLNRAIALAEWKGPDAGLAALAAIEPPSWLLGY